MVDVKSHRKGLSRRADGVLFLVVGSISTFTLGFLASTLTIFV